MGAQEVKQLNPRFIDDIIYEACVFNKENNLIWIIERGKRMPPSLMGIQHGSRDIAATKKELASSTAQDLRAEGNILGICKREIKNTLIL